MYKVLRRENEKLYSSIIDLPGWKTEYVVGEKTYPQYQNSGLFVFKSLHEAILYHKDGIDIWEVDLEIWGVEVDSPEPMHTAVSNIDNPDLLLQFWKEVPLPEHVLLHLRYLVEVFMCKSLTLIGRII